jgi:exopolysaccharide biosynthesis polyprenyl glycosylphosphotransferase
MKILLEERQPSTLDDDKIVGAHTPTKANSKPNSPRYKHRVMAADFAALAVGIGISFALQSLLKPVPSFILAEQFLLTFAFVPGYAIGAAINRLYQARANVRPAEENRHLFNSVMGGIGTLVVVAFLLQYKDLSRLWIFLLAGSTLTTLLVERQIARREFAKLRAEGRMSRRIIIVGTDSHAIGLVHTYARNPDLGYEVVGFVGDDELGPRNSVAVLGGIDQLEEILRTADANGVVFSLSSIPSGVVNTLTRSLTDAGYHVAISSALNDIDVTRLRPQELAGRTLIYVEPVIRNGWRATTKRAFDITLASLILVASLPILIVSMILIKVTSTGPIFFNQIRTGKDGQEFEILKLRTMSVDAEERRAALATQNESDGPLFKMTHDPRVTRVGRVLRKLSIDELPQLWCVLRGTMSMVGPRPALPDEVVQWEISVRERLRVLPGLTGMWQVSGRSNSSFEEYKRLDLYYVDNWSLAHDLRICRKTVRVILTGHGAA